MSCNSIRRKENVIIGIVGLGLIGGSLGLALKGCRYPAAIIGYDAEVEAINKAMERDIIDQGTVSVEELGERSDIVILAVPVIQIWRLAPVLRGCVRKAAIVTDVGSAKVEICRTMEETLPEGVYFVGGHPMSGSECSGIDAARPDLFNGASYVLTRTPRTSDEALGRIQELVSSLGAVPVVMSPEEHDSLVAVTSHLVYLLACGLVRSVTRVSVRQPVVKRLVAGAFRDMTRVVSGDPRMSAEMCLSNREMIQAAYSGFIDEMRELMEMLYSDEVGLKAELERLKQSRNEILRSSDQRATA